jgi:peptide/nickel transport system ATP-binding protein
MPLLQIRNLTIDFILNNSPNRALQGINLTAERGKTLAIVGESGSGKSITSLSVLGLLPSPPARYTSGEIVLQTGDKAIDLLQATPEEISRLRGNRIAMIFQEPMTSLNPVMTCGTQVMEAIRTHQSVSAAAAKQKTVDLFTQVQLPDPEQLFYRYPHQLSGGQKQRVMIAMAMSCEPDLLICDEPTTALDVTVQKKILDLIRQLQQLHNMAVIFITHDLGVVADIADEVAVLYKGQLVEMAAVKEIFTRPQHPYTKALLACRPSLHPKGQKLPVVSDFMEVDENSIISEKLPVTGHHPAVSSQQSADHDEHKTQNTEPPTGNQKPANNALLSVKHLSVWYPAKKNWLGKPLSYIKAVDDISFDLYPGETLGLVGESGCGKSTLGRAILRLIPATAGSIHFQGKNLMNASDPSLRNLRSNMQLIFQDPYSSLNPRLKIGDAIAEPLEVHGRIPDAGKRKEYVISLLEKVGLSADHYQRYPHAFSGGQRQRIVIARALALQPAFVICDESVSALDVSVQAQVLNLLNDLKQEFGFTSIFISHDLSVVRYLSDRILVMNKGRIEESGTAEQVCNNPQSTYTQQLIESMPGFVR